jgi:SAM-dependent methyltransferase
MTNRSSHEDSGAEIVQRYYQTSDTELAQRYIRSTTFLSREYCERALAHRYSLYPFIEPFVQFDSWKGRDVLEIGCGQGADLSRFAAAGARTVGCDLTAKHCTISRAFLERLDLGAGIVQTQALHLPFASGSFDLVYSFGVLLLVADLPAAVAEIKRVLRPGGTVITMFYNRLSFHYLVKTLQYYGTVCDLERLLGPRRLVDWFTDGYGYPRTFHQTPDSLRDAFDGFTIDALSVRNLTPEQLPLVDRSRYPAEFWQWLESRAGFYLMLRAHR